MQQPRIEAAAKIERPIQLLAASLIGLVLIETAFLAMSYKSDDVVISRSLAAAAIIFAPVFVYAIFTILTRHRNVILTDAYYIKYVEAVEARFKGFSPQAIQSEALSQTVSPVVNSEFNLDKDEDFGRGRAPYAAHIRKVNPRHEAIGVTNEIRDKDGQLLIPDAFPAHEREKARQAVYAKNRGLFVVHSWRPSRAAGQLVDMSIVIRYHKRENSAAYSQISKVEYYLGPNFTDKPVITTDEANFYRFDVSAFDSVLCLARVHFKNGEKPINIYRYLNFEMKEDLPKS